MYSQTIKLKDNELPAKVNVETGEIKEVTNKKNNIPEGKSKLGYANFGMLNIELTSKLEKYFSNIEISVIFKMINRCEFNTNSLKPFNNETSVRILSQEFNIGVNQVNKVFKRLFQLGVYLQLSICENDEEIEYWVLNPNIFWKGRLKQDSIFDHFRNTDITRLLK